MPYADELCLAGSLSASAVREGNEGMDFKASFLLLLPIGDNALPMCREATLFLFGETTLTLVVQDEPTSWISEKPFLRIICAARVWKAGESKTSDFMGDRGLCSSEEHPAVGGVSLEHVDGSRKEDLKKNSKC